MITTINETKIKFLYIFMIATINNTIIIFTISYDYNHKWNKSNFLQLVIITTINETKIKFLQIVMNATKNIISTISYDYNHK